MPGGRHLHQEPIPRGGGIAVIFSFFISYLLFSWSKGFSPECTKLFIQLAVPTVILVVLGLLDDRFSLRGSFKLVVHIIVGIIIYLMNNEYAYVLGKFELPWIASLVFYTIWAVLFINAFNLIDGLDGLSSGLSAISAICMAIMFIMSGKNLDALCMIIMIGSCLGFLRYNFPPAKIFLGDTGSTFIGMFFAVISISSIYRVVTITSLLLPLLVIGIPLLDVGLAVWRRSVRNILDPESNSIIDGDQDHLHHRLLRSTGNQAKVILIMYLLACLFSVLAIILYFFRDHLPEVGCFILIVTMLICIRYLAAIEIYDSIKLLRRIFLKPQRNAMIAIVHPVIDLVILLTSALISGFFMQVNCPPLPLFLILILPTVLLLCCSRTYKIFWLRANLADYMLILKLIGLGALITTIVLYAIYFLYPYLPEYYGNNYILLFNWVLLFMLLSMVLIILERAMLIYVGFSFYRKVYLHCQPKDKNLKTIIYGSGVNCNLYINYQTDKNNANKDEEIIGIIDDDPALGALYVYGFKVIGDVYYLDELFAKMPFHKIVITTDIDTKEKVDHLLSFCKKHQIEVTKFMVSESPESKLFYPHQAQ